jgi:hypothetical protein
MAGVDHQRANGMETPDRLPTEHHAGQGAAGDRIAPVHRICATKVYHQKKAWDAVAWL